MANIVAIPNGGTKIGIEYAQHNHRVRVESWNLNFKLDAMLWQLSVREHTHTKNFLTKSVCVYAYVHTPPYTTGPIN